MSETPNYLQTRFFKLIVLKLPVIGSGTSTVVAWLTCTISVAAVLSILGADVIAVLSTTGPSVTSPPVVTGTFVVDSADTSPVALGGISSSVDVVFLVICRPKEEVVNSSVWVVDSPPSSVAAVPKN